jgi:hypothetical protein
MTLSNSFSKSRKTLFQIFQSRLYRLGLSVFVLFLLSSILFSRHASRVGHKAWLMSWAYADIFHPPEYDAEKVEIIARLKLYAQFHDPRTIQILGHRPFGEEAVIYTIQHFKPDGSILQTEKLVWVHWKPWTMNNGTTILRESDSRQLVNTTL